MFSAGGGGSLLLTSTGVLLLGLILTNVWGFSCWLYKIHVFLFQLTGNRLNVSVTLSTAIAYLQCIAIDDENWWVRTENMFEVDFQSTEKYFNDLIG